MMTRSRPLANHVHDRFGTGRIGGGKEHLANGVPRPHPATTQMGTALGIVLTKPDVNSAHSDPLASR